MRGDAERLGAGSEDGTVDVDAVLASKADAERDARRRVVKLNKLALAAQDVRRAKLTEAFGRKTLPKGSSAVVSRFPAEPMWPNHDLFPTAPGDPNTKNTPATLPQPAPTQPRAKASP